MPREFDHDISLLNLKDDPTLLPRSLNIMSDAGWEMVGPLGINPAAGQIVIFWKRRHDPNRIVPANMVPSGPTSPVTRQ